MPRHPRSPRGWSPLLGLLLITSTAALGGCSVKQMAIETLADTLAGDTGGALSQDEDLDLVGDAVPVFLKLMEVIRDQAPDHVGIHQALASGFTQYGMVWVQFPAEQQKYDDFEAYRAGLERATRLYLRAHRYALMGMEIRHPGFSAQVRSNTDAALAVTTVEDVPLLYWTGASWLAAISNSREDPELIGELPIAAAFFERALELDPGWGDGALHEMMISLQPSMPMPGGAGRAREHYARALELSGGGKASPHVSLATALTIKAQDRDEFEELLGKALAVDVEARPDDRLANEFAQRKARWLLQHVDDLFLTAEDDPALAPLPDEPAAPTPEEP